VNFGFQDIKDIGIGCWGYLPADYLFRNVNYTLQDNTAPHPTECPAPGDGASLTIDTQATSTTAGATVNLFGNLTDQQNDPLTNKTVVLYYTFEGLDMWMPISSAITNEQGQYNIQWINTASGTFTLKAKWSGDETYIGASNTTSLTFYPMQTQQDQTTQMFVFESNSTVSALTFDASATLLSFNVSGPSETTGYVKVTIAKSLLSNGDALVASIDNTTMTYTLTETENTWVYTFNYSHSTHKINLIMPNPATTTTTSTATSSSSSASSTQKPNAIDENFPIVALVAFVGILLGVCAYKLNPKNRQKRDNFSA
jgi:hypothetical protein